MEQQELGADSFPPVDLPRAGDIVTKALIDGIRAGVAPEGARLPRDYDLAERFGVSRAVVREALDRLRRAGIIDVRRGNGGGAVVRSLEIPTSLLTDRTSLADGELRHLLESRRAVEMACAALAAERASQDDLAALGELVDRLSETRGDPGEFIELDVRFHLRIASSSANRQLEAFLAGIFRQLAAIRSGYPTRYGSMEAAEAFQRDTFNALRSRDRAAVLVSMDPHLAALEEHFLGAAIVLDDR